MAAMGQVTNFQMCLNPSCSSGQIREPGDAEPIMICYECGYKMYFTHKSPWHESETCQEVEVRLSQPDNPEFASNVAVEASTKRCPNPKCGAAISKISGCDQMTCE